MALESASSPWTGLLISFCFCLAFVLVGGVLIWLTILARRRTAESQRWPTVPGRVVSSEVRRSVSQDADGNSSTDYQAEVQYTYSVSGASFTGQRLTFAVQESSYTAALDNVQRYPPGAAVAVHYNPRKPEEAVLEVQQSSGNTWMMVAGIVFAALGILSMCIGLTVSIIQFLY